MPRRVRDSAFDILRIVRDALPGAVTYGTCAACRGTVYGFARPDGNHSYVDEHGGTVCPAVRECALAYYRRAFKIDPLALLDHDTLCTCRAPFPHKVAYEVTAFKVSPPVCCGEPAQLTIGGYRCRRCRRRVTKAD